MLEEKLRVQYFLQCWVGFLSPFSPVTMHFLTTEDGREMMIKGNLLPHSHSHTVSDFRKSQQISNYHIFNSHTSPRKRQEA